MRLSQGHLESTGSNMAAQPPDVWYHAVFRCQVSELQEHMQTHFVHEIT